MAASETTVAADFPAAEVALAASFERHRPVLFAIAYRMLGSVADAEDILQDAYIRFQRAADRPIGSEQALLVTIVSRLCITYLQSARVRREAYVGQWLPEPLETAPAADAEAPIDESLSLALLVVLQRLAPLERIVFVLREVLDYSFAQLAQVVERTEENCRQILRRARLRLESAQTRFAPSTKLQEEVLKEFLQVIAGGQLEPLLTLLSQDVVLHSDGGGKGPAFPVPIAGIDRVARGLIGANRKLVAKGLRTHLLTLNGQPAAVSFRDRQPYSVVSVQLESRKITALFIISNPDKLRHLVVPESTCLDVSPPEAS